MQRYRVNYPLLIGIVVGSIVLFGGGFALWRFQLNRNADRLITLAEQAQDEGDIKECIKQYAQYLAIRTNDTQVTSKLANAYADLIDEPDVEPKLIRKAFAIMENTVSEQPENQEVRRRLIDLWMRFGSYKNALDHVSQLLNQKPRDPELEEIRTRCYFAISDPKAIDHALNMIGYDKQADAFDVESAILPNDTAVYLRLARSLRNEKREEELATRVINQLVDANPEDGKAFLYRSEYLRGTGEKEAADEDIGKALAASPDEPEIVRANALLLLATEGDEEVSDEAYAEAIAMLEKCLETNPDAILLYQTLAGIEAQRGDIEAAEDWFNKGIENVEESQTRMLRFYLARMQVQMGDLEKARETIKVLREKSAGIEGLLDFLDARILAAENKWFEAAEEFERLRAAVNRFPELNLELNLFLGLSYERLGQLDKALSAYEVTLQSDGKNKMAAFGRSRILERQGQADQANASYSIYTALTTELAKDEEDQDWEAFDDLVEQYCDRLDLSEAMRLVLRGEVDMRRGLYGEARKKLLDAFKLDKDNLGVRRAAVKLFASDPEQGPVKALKLLEKVVEDLGDMPILRLEEADLLIAINDEDLTEQLFALADNMGDWERDQQVQVWNGLAQRFSQLRDNASRQACLSEVAELSPRDLSTLENLFLMARQADDQAGMQEIQDRVLKVVGSKDRPEWMFTEANRLISIYRTQDRRQEVLEEAKALVMRSLDLRPDWHQLYLVKAEIALLNSDINEALTSFDRASELGRPTATALFQHVKLLMKSFRYDDAIRQMEKINPEGRAVLLGRDYAEALFRTGKVEKALAAVDEVIEAAPNNAQAQLWQGQILTQLSASKSLSEERRKMLQDKAGEALQKAVDLDPSSSEAWGALISYLATSGRQVEANDVVRRAQLVLPEDVNRLMYARCYEVLRRPVDARERYIQALEDAKPEDRARTLRLLAQFYLSPNYGREDHIEKATPLINELLKEVAEGKVEPSNQHARWARSSAARIFAQTARYQDLRAAENLLSSNAVDGRLAAEDRLLMAQILIGRPEPVSRLKAVELLEGLRKTSTLNAKTELELGKLYYSLDRWSDCRQQMTEIIALYPKNTAIRLAYLDMLLEKGGPNEINVAVRQLSRLAEIAPSDLSTRIMASRVAMKRGKKKEAVQALRSMLPRNLNDLEKEQAPLVLKVAELLTEYEDYDGAEPLYRLAATKGTAVHALGLASFLGEHREPSQGFEVLESLAGDIPMTAVLQTAMRILRESEDVEGIEEQTAIVKKWLDRSLREDPDLIALRLLHADYLGYQREYEEAAEVYRSMLEMPDLKGASRAVVLNNLAYNLALTSNSSEKVREAVKFIGEAVDILGPQSEVLDTRGVIAIADKRFDDAIQDLELSVIDRPTASKYFHLAVARLAAGQKDLAIKAWQEAIDLGLTRESISRLERDRFDSVKQELGGGGLASTSF